MGSREKAIMFTSIYISTCLVLRGPDRLAPLRKRAQTFRAFLATGRFREYGRGMLDQARWLFEAGAPQKLFRLSDSVRRTSEDLLKNRRERRVQTCGRVGVVLAALHPVPDQRDDAEGDRDRGAARAATGNRDDGGADILYAPAA